MKRLGVVAGFPAMAVPEFFAPEKGVSSPWMPVSFPFSPESYFSFFSGELECLPEVV